MKEPQTGQTETQVFEKTPRWVYVHENKPTPWACGLRVGAQAPPALVGVHA